MTPFAKRQQKYNVLEYEFKTEQCYIRKVPKTQQEIVLELKEKIKARFK